jgi:hypothetical protein
MASGIVLNVSEKPIVMKMTGNGARGLRGATIVTIQLTDTDGHVDTYTITDSDGKKYNFTVTNGYTPTFVVGDVTTLPAGSDATVTVEFDEETESVVLNFGIPRGYDGSGTWGSIPGTLSDQTDLQNALDGKSDAGHNHDDRYYTETEIDGKLGSIASANYTISNNDLTEGVSELPSGDLYFYYE